MVNNFSTPVRRVSTRSLLLTLRVCLPQVWLPPKDDVLAPGVFNQGTPGPRWFDFSSAPDVDGFDSSACSADITWAGQRAFHMHQREQRKG